MHVYYLESQYHDKVVTKENKPVMVAFFCMLNPPCQETSFFKG